MPFLADRVKETVSFTGTGSVPMTGSAPTGFRTFASTVPSGSLVNYCIQNTATGEWEVGKGRFMASPAVSLLLHGDGANGGTVITDSSGNNLSPQSNSGVTTNTTTPKFGTASLLNGADFGLTYANTELLQLNDSSDWTIECWINPTNLASATNTIIAKRANSGTAAHYELAVSSAGTLIFYNGTAYNHTTTITSGAWQHIAAERYKGILSTYVGGVGVVHGNVAPNQSRLTDLLCIGNVSGGGQGYNGRIDDLRITKGYARYRGNFTPPTAALVDPAADIQFVREFIRSSSNAGNLVNFGAGSKELFVTAPAEFLDNANHGMQYAMSRGFAIP